MSDRIVVAGRCPFLLCTEQDPHAHPVCQTCGAVRFGNMFCATCQVERKKYNDRRDYAVLVPLEGPIP